LQPVPARLIERIARFRAKESAARASALSSRDDSLERLEARDGRRIGAEGVAAAVGIWRATSRSTSVVAMLTRSSCEPTAISSRPPIVLSATSTSAPAPRVSGVPGRLRPRSARARGGAHSGSAGRRSGGAQNRPAGRLDRGTVYGDSYFLQALLRHERWFAGAPRHRVR
jgi:hypothetical protein